MLFLFGASRPGRVHPPFPFPCTEESIASFGKSLRVLRPPKEWGFFGDFEARIERGGCAEGGKKQSGHQGLFSQAWGGGTGSLQGELPSVVIWPKGVGQGRGVVDRD